jgi:hypothetical protein
MLDIFSVWWEWLFAGVLRNPHVFAWCFCGEFVVKGWLKLVPWWPLFLGRKFSTFFNFIFGE